MIHNLSLKDSRLCKTGNAHIWRLWQKWLRERRVMYLKSDSAWGISASYIQAFGAKSYTVIECNEGVKGEFENLAEEISRSEN